jgi:uncharacterized membrane protein
MLTVLVITVKFEVPMNKLIQSWTAGAAPTGWSEVRDQWLRNHLLRTIAGIASFICAALGLARL